MMEQKKVIRFTCLKILLFIKEPYKPKEMKLYANKVLFKFKNDMLLIFKNSYGTSPV